MRVGCVQLIETLMEFKEAIKLALQSLWQNKMRTVLTLLGVTIGVASVIAVVTLVNGANTYVTDKFTRYGADVFTISRFPALITNATDYERFQRRKNILYDDYAYVRDNCTHCIGIGAQQATVAKVTRGTNSVTDPTIRGYTWQMPSLENLDIAEGRDFTQVDDDHASSVAIIGTDIRDNLFPGIDPLGQELRVDGQPYTVVGVAEKQGSTFGQSQDNWVGIPLTAFMKTYGTSKSVTIYVKAGSAGPVLQQAGDEVRVLMRSKRHDLPGQPDSFELDVNNTLVGFVSVIADMIGAVAAGIAMIALIVGGIVIMNMMLVSVSERTREIGCAGQGHYTAVSGGVRVDGAAGRVLRRNDRRGTGRDCDAGARVSVHGHSVERCGRPGDGDGHRNLLRCVSGVQGGASGSDCGAAVGTVKTVAGG
jgi:putative ABC transport system permease protein